MAKDAKSNQDILTDRMAAKKEKKLAAQKKAQKESRKNLIITICVVAVLAIFAGLLIFNKCMTNGSIERRTVVAETENFEVTQAMMTYFFNTSYNQYASYYSSNSDSMQSFIDDVNSKGTNYTYLMSMAKQTAEQYLTLAEMAKAEDIELDSADEAEIDAAIDNYKEMKVNYGQTNNSYTMMTFDRFLEVMFGDSVNESVVRDCLELSVLASKYQEEFTEALDYTDEQYETYYKDNIDNYLYVDLLKYTFEEPKDNTADEDADAVEGAADAEAAEDTADAESEAEESAESEAKLNADALAASKTPDEYVKYMTDYLTKVQEDNTAEGEEVDKDAIQANVDALENTKQLKSNITDEEAKDWAFADDAKVGSTKVVYDETAGSYTVYMLKATAYRDEELTKKAAAIYLTDTNNDGNSEPAGNKIKEEWDAAADKSEDAFLALAEKYSESSHNHVEEGYTRNTSDIGEWLFEDGRAVGDVGVIHSDTNACTYVVYFAGDGMEGWKSSVKSALANEDFSDAMKAFAKDHMVNEDEENPSMVTFDDAKINNVKPISLNANSNS